MLRLLLALAMPWLLASCASTRTLLAEERADRETIEEAHASEDPELRCLAARSCLWDPVDGCDRRLASLVAEDEAPSVRACALELLAARCTDDARAALVGLRRALGSEVEAVAFVEAASRCPAADLYFDLAEAGVQGRVVHLVPAPEPGAEGRWIWLQELATLDPPRERTLAALEEARREVDLEEAEEARRRQADERLRQAEVRLGQGDHAEARRLATEAAMLGADAAELLRRAQMAGLLEGGRVLEEARTAPDVERALERLAAVPEGFEFLYPEGVGVVLVRAYERDLRLAEEAEDLALRGEEEAALFHLRQLPSTTLTQPFRDLASLAEAEALELLRAGEFDPAWERAWLARTDFFILAEPFLRAYAETRWQREGRTMDREQLAAYLRRVEGHAPPEARERAFIFELEERVRGGEVAAARALLKAVEERAVRAAGYCYGKTKGEVPEPLEELTIEQVGPVLEYGAKRVTTTSGRQKLRAKKAQSERMAKRAERLLDELETIDRGLDACADSLRLMELYRGARPGSEAYGISSRAGREILRCAADAEVVLRRWEEQGAACLRVLNETSELLQEVFADE